MDTLRTNRLILRPWKESDLGPFAEINADPRVMEYFPSVLSREESDRLANDILSKAEENGFGLWAVSLPGIADFIGFIGLNIVTFPARFTPATEIGWRLAFSHWGKGYATEGAKAVIRYGFEKKDFEEIVSFTAVENVRSRRVMEKIGMDHDPEDDFDHPRVPRGLPLERHVLYRLKKSRFRKENEKKKYVYKPYNNIFPMLFLEEKERIASSLPFVLAIEHVGSTAIPGLGGKGIIDIAVAVTPEDKHRAREALEKIGYEYRSSFGTPDRLYCIADLPDPEEGIRRYHLHVLSFSSRELKELIGFRDYLRSCPEAAQEYAAVKKEAALLAEGNGKRYRELKEPIFRKILTFFEASDG